MKNILGSTSFSLSVDELKSVGRGLLIALGGTTLTYLSAWIGNTDFTVHINCTLDQVCQTLNLTPVVVAAWSVVVNFARKWIPDTR